MMTILEDSACSVTPTIQTKQLVGLQKAKSVDICGYFISSVNLVPSLKTPKSL